MQCGFLLPIIRVKYKNELLLVCIMLGRKGGLYIEWFFEQSVLLATANI